MSGEVKTILKYGHPDLYKKAKIVEDPSHPEVQKLIQDMLATIDHLGASGVAAPQIGTPLSIAIYRVPKQTDNPKYVLTPEYDPDGVPLTVMINPKVTPLGDEMIDTWEGCLSLPGMLGKVARYKSVLCEYTTPEGDHTQREAHGFHARVIQHECDHLGGILYPTHLKDVRDLGYQDEILSSGRFVL